MRLQKLTSGACDANLAGLDLYLDALWDDKGTGRYELLHDARNDPASTIPCPAEALRALQRKASDQAALSICSSCWS